MKHSNIIHIAAAIIANRHHQLLLVRKQNSRYFMQAGGKIEPAESPVNALTRELYEELKLVVQPQQCNYIGEFIESAANEVNYQVHAYLYWISMVPIDIKAHAELAEIGWYSIKQAENLCLAPLTKNVVLPIAKNQFDHLAYS